MTEQQLTFSLDGESSHSEDLNLLDARATLHRNFLSQQKADTLLATLLSETPWRQDYLTFGGKKVLVPRLQAWIGDTSSEYGYSGLRLSPLPWTAALTQIKKLIEVEAGTSFNSVLLNYYRNGQDSVAWHSDDEKELGENPVIASLSLGVSRRFELKHMNHAPTLKYNCPLDHGSLLIMGAGLQKNWQHQLPKQAEISLPRINLTFRKIIL